MRYIVVALLILAGCSTAVPKKTSDYCLTIDSEQGFARCESGEVVCYMTKSGQTCWTKPAPAPSPEPKK